MKILTIDTSTDLMYAGLSENNEIISERLIESTKERYSTALLIPTIIEILKENNLLMPDIKAIGINIGPGSFTGLRASATITRIFGQHLNIPTVGISSLEIIALLNKTNKDSLCLMDARRGKAYMGIYTISGEIKKKPCLISYEEAVNILSDDFNIFVDNKMYSLLNKENLFNIQLSNVTTMLSTNDVHKYILGHNLIKLTNKYLTRDINKDLLWHNLSPLYIQSPAISMPKTL